VFLGGVLGIAAAYAIGAVYVGLGIQIGKALLHSANSLVASTVIALSAATIGIVAILSRPAPSLAKIIAGAALTLPGMAALVLAGLSRALVLFIISAIVCGAAYSLLFAAGLALIGRTAPPGQRGAALSAGYIVAYAVQAATALGLGAVATVSGFQLAVGIALPITSRWLSHRHPSPSPAGAYSDRCKRRERRRAAASSPQNQQAGNPIENSRMKQEGESSAVGSTDRFLTRRATRSARLNEWSLRSR
jgi:MFS family permease